MPESIERREWYGPELNRKGINKRRTDEKFSIDDIRDGKMNLRQAKKGQVADDKNVIADKLQEWTDIRIKYAAGGVEAVSDHPLLRNWKEDYENPKFPQSKISWEEIVDRLMAKEGHYLNLAQGLQDGGVLWGVDRNGNPLFADKGTEPVMKGMSYDETLAALYGKDFSNRKKLKTHIGYEMFDKGKTIEAIEEFTGEPFVAGGKNDYYRSSYLFTGKYPVLVRYASSFQNLRKVRIFHDNQPKTKYIRRGVRRLLRVKKLPETI